ncbi:EXOC3-like protein [Mya arenaria]|uniref:EXOC3-like protein n=1 Tax=Mya arenaria TaxID=6604 RepID=A0ABY7F5U0_MYAAR|nr:EXOC3-like protein [Mya arenaria]
MASRNSLLTPQAPLDLGRLEKQAKENGTKYVASLLQRPDQLERASVETMLKTAVQSQLDGVRTGLNQLQSALHDLATAMENLKHIFTVPESTLQKYFADVAKLSVTLGKQLWIILQRVLMSVRREPTLIVTALRIIEREEKIEGNQMEDRSGNKMWLVRHLEVTRQIMLEDLRVAKTLLPAVFPPSYNIIQEMISQQLEGNEFVSLLSWLNSYDSPELMKHPSLEINTKDLGPLLDDNQDWCRDEGPDQDGEGFYNTSLPIQVAMVLGKDIVISSLEQFVEVLSDFAEQLKGVVVIYKDRHLNDRREPKFYLHYLIATCNNLLTFGEYMKQLRKRYLKNEYDKEDDDETNSRNDRFLVLKDTFNKIAAAVVEYILDEVLIDLKNHEHCFNELMTKNWKLTFKQYEERKNAAEKMIKESEQLEFMFQKYKEDEEVTFAILPMMAESLKLKDTSMLSLEIAGMMKRFPDIRLDQMINLLLCRGDMSRSEARQMVIETVGEEKAQRSVNVGIFHELFNEMK